jgi:hypothetical protein
MTKSNTKVVPIDEKGTSLAVHPGTMIQALMEAKDVDVGKLEKMFELQERWEANEARKAYHTAMAQFGAMVPPIVYDQWVHYKNSKGDVTEYGFTSLAESLTKCQEAMETCGLKATWQTDILEDKSIQVTCYITHALGHSENTALSAAPDPSGGKNAIQAVKSTVSYLKRITFEALAGLATKADDADDGRNAGPEVKFITNQQLKSLTTKIAKVGAETKKLCELFEVESLDQLRADQYKPVQALLTAKEKADKAASK